MSESKVRMEEKLFNGKTFYKLYDNESDQGFVTEAERKIPVAYDVDVVVAGGGVSGLFAAIAAGRMGARTLLIDRFGTLGGNIGPGMVKNGRMRGSYGRIIKGGPSGIPKEFLERLEELKNTPRLTHLHDDIKKLNYADISNVASYLAFKMTEEAGTELLLSAYVTDPIMEDNKVKGVFVEGKSGRMAIKAKVVIDGTGDASVAERSGAAVINFPPDPSYAKTSMVREHVLLSDFDCYNETSMPGLIGGVDFERCEKFKSEESGVVQTESGEPGIMEFRSERHAIIKYGKRKFMLRKFSNSIAYYKARFNGRYETNSMYQMSFVEQYLRKNAFEDVLQLRKSVPGFENAYMMCMSPYIGARGGPCIEGEHVLTFEEAYNGAKFDDVIFVNVKKRGFVKSGYNKEGFDTPYRILLPKKIGGLMVTGRGSSYMRRGHDGTGSRLRVSLMSMGQAAGTAAALAVKTNADPKKINVKMLQKELIKEGYVLGNDERLKELGLK